MKNFRHGKKELEDTAPAGSADTAAMAPETDGADNADQSGNEAVTDKDLETENLKNAIAQVMAEETAVLPHIEQLSSSVAKESGLTDDEDEDAAKEDNDESEAASSADEAAAAASVASSDTQASISSWFITFMAMRIPVVGWIYLLYLAFSRKTKNRRNFARAYILIKLIFLVLGLIILWLLISMAMNILQDLLDYMAML